MMKDVAKSIILLFLVSCSSSNQGTFNSRELISSKGEKIYINSLNWGVTDDYQMTIISHNKKRAKKRSDTIDVVKGLEPFIYSYKNDSLKLFFENQVTYKLKEELKTISVEYVVLSNEEYMRARTKSYENDIYFSVPLRTKIEYPIDFPKAPSN